MSDFHITQRLNRPPEAAAGEPANAEPRDWLVLGLGSNQDRPRQQLIRALGEIDLRYGPLFISPLYRSPPLPPPSGEIEQPDFLNTVAMAQLPLPGGEGPEAVLKFAKQLERLAGRRPAPRWWPRPLDVDVLLFGDVERHDTHLTLPHPGLRQRRFVLAPLADLLPELRLPTDGIRVSELLNQLPQSAAPVERLCWSDAEID